MPSRRHHFHHVPLCSIVFYHIPSFSIMFQHLPSCFIVFHQYQYQFQFKFIIHHHHRRRHHHHPHPHPHPHPSSSIIINHRQSPSIIINHHQSSITTNQSINQSINQPTKINQSISHIHYHLLCNPPAGWFLEISRFFWCCHPLLHHPFEHPSMTYCIKTKSAWRFLKNMRSSVGIILPNRWKNKIHCQCTFTVFVEDVYFRCLIVSDSNITMVLICFDHVKAPFCLEKSVGIQGA